MDDLTEAHGHTWLYFSWEMHAELELEFQGFDFQNKHEPAHGLIL